jgi:hypothetical protein
MGGRFVPPPDTAVEIAGDSVSRAASVRTDSTRINQLTLFWYAT